MFDTSFITDPFKFQRLCWPDITFYDKQCEIIQSVVENEETVVPAGNDLGKDFIAGFIAVWFQCSRTPCRIVSTSSSQTQLKSVLWGEMSRFIQTSRVPLPLEQKDLWLQTKMPDGSYEPRSYHRGIVCRMPETLQGHHVEWGKLSEKEIAHLEQLNNHKLPYDGLPRTLAILDEASGVHQAHYDATDTWAHRKLVIGNPLECTMFKALVEGGDILAEDK